MCDLIDDVCHWWTAQLDSAQTVVQDPVLTFCIASPRPGELGWHGYHHRDLDANRADPFTIEECKAFAEEARRRGHWEMAKLVALSAGVVVATAALFVGMIALITLVELVTIELFVTLATIPFIAEIPLLQVAIILIGAVVAMVEYSNALPAICCVIFCTWTKEGIPQIRRSVAHMHHLYERARVLEIEAARDPEPALAQGA